LRSAVSAPRIAILAGATHPRGGTVHALELGDALSRLGHDTTVFAPDPAGTGFFRGTLCATEYLAASSVEGDPRATVDARILDYVRHFEPAENRRFDVWHATHYVPGVALAMLKERGLIYGFALTVHHILGDERFRPLQLQAVNAADYLFVVSRMWRDWFVRELKREACCVGNGVDRNRFSPEADETDDELRARLNLPVSAPIFLAVGGIEERKNTIQILRAFQFVRVQHPSARLVIAGGDSLVEYGAYKVTFAEVLAQSGVTEAVAVTGPLPQKLMPALYRAATSLVFPSLREGFGLVVLEAMASGIPVITSRKAPFTEYLGEDDVLWCDPLVAASIAEAMERSLDPARRPLLIARGKQVAAGHDWDDIARAHLPTYQKLLGRSETSGKVKFDVGSGLLAKVIE